jgi:hypothetical protein
MWAGNHLLKNALKVIGTKRSWALKRRRRRRRSGFFTTRPKQRNQQSIMRNLCLRFILV